MPRLDLGRHLRRVMGLDAAAIGPFVIDRAIRDRQRATGCDDVAAYRRLVMRSPEELQELIDLVVVPETWFFRDPAAFATLARVLRDEWLTADRTRVIRLLSLPCASGEEPYSMAMALLDAGVPPAQFCVDAIDISRRLIAQARAGVYRKTAFRGEAVDFRDRHFVQVDGGYEVLPKVRAQVQFAAANLLDAACLPGTGVYDVIFCRNLLIYFDAPARERAATVLSRLLKPQGWLFVGSSEVASLGTVFTPARIPMAFALRKAEVVAPSPAPLPTPSSPRAFARATVSPPPPRAVPEAGALAHGTRLANAGRLDEAKVQVERDIRHHGPTADALYLLGLLQDAAGDRAGAAAHYRKALYLDPRHQDALLHLAVLMDGDDRGEATRLRARARRAQDGRR